MNEDQRILLPRQFSNQLVNSPETGMGYHKIDLYLRDGKLLEGKIVLNCTVLILDQEIKLDVKEIEKIVLSKT